MDMERGMTTDDLWNLGMTADDSRTAPGPIGPVLLALLIKIGGETIGPFLFRLGPKWPGDVENPSAASGECQDNELNAYFGISDWDESGYPSPRMMVYTRTWYYIVCIANIYRSSR